MSYGLRNVAHVGFRVLGAVVLLTTVILFLYSAHEVYYACASRSWPQTRGTIVDKTETATKQVVPNLRGRGYRTRVSFHQHVQYDYLVDGHNYRGTRIAYWDHGYSERVGLEPLYGEVPVFYDPQEPSRSVLIPGLRRSLFPSLVLVALGLGVGTVFACLGVRVFEWIGLRGRR
jgi:hypothetical protein